VQKSVAVLPVKKAFLALFIVFLFSPLALALENCADMLSFTYTTNAIIQIYGEDVSPGGNSVLVRSLKPLAFHFGDIANDSTQFFYIAAQQQIRNGKVIMTLGEVFYKPQYGEAGFNTEYFKRAGSLKPVYVESGLALEPSFQSNYSFSYGGRSFSTPVLKVTYPSKLTTFGFNASAGNAVIILTQMLDQVNSKLAIGSVFLETTDGDFVYADNRRLRFIGACTTGSCTDPDSHDYLRNSTCKSDLVDASDYCAGSSDLVEFTCSPNEYCTPEKTPCPFGCKGGKCLPGQNSKCADTDELNPSQKGRAFGNYENATIYNYLDRCDGSTRVLEYYCTDGKLLQQQVLDCPNNGACVDGACVSQPTTPSCSDTDGGKNYEVQGVCSDSSGSFKDSCTENGVNEYYCNGGYCKSVTSPCPSCVSGYCPKSSLVQSNYAGPSGLEFAIGLLVILGLVAAVVFFWSKKNPHYK